MGCTICGVKEGLVTVSVNVNSIARLELRNTIPMMRLYLYLLQDCTVLAYLLDNLLPPCQDSGDKDCPALARVVVTSLAACNHSPEAQMTLVAELKSAIQRALVLPESSEKHSKVQALTSIISTMIEACPTPGQVPNEVFKVRILVSSQSISCTGHRCPNVFTKSMRVLCHSSCYCHRTKHTYDVLLPSLFIAN